MSATLSEVHLDSFARDGFVVVEGLLGPECIESLYRTTVNVMRVWRPDVPRDFADAQPFESGRFHEEMRRFRAEAPAQFGAMYDAVQVSASLQQAMCTAPLVAAAARLLDDETEGLATTGMMLRMDAPD